MRRPTQHGSLPALRQRMEREEQDLRDLDQKADALRRALEVARAGTEAALVRLGSEVEKCYRTCHLPASASGRLAYFAGASLVLVPNAARAVGDLSIALIKARADEQEAGERFNAVAHAYASTAEALAEMRDLELEIMEQNR